MKLSLLGAAAFLASSASAFAPAPVTTTNRRVACNIDAGASTTVALRMADEWYDEDVVVTLVPKFKIKNGMRGPYEALLPKFTELVKANEADTCVHYGFVGPTDDGFVICREGYVSAEGVLAHLDNVGDVLNKALEYADIVDLMVQGPAAELEKLKGPLKDFGPAYYPIVEGAIRNKKQW